MLGCWYWFVGILSRAYLFCLYLGKPFSFFYFGRRKWSGVLFLASYFLVFSFGRLRMCLFWRGELSEVVLERCWCRGISFLAVAKYRYLNYSSNPMISFQRLCLIVKYFSARINYIQFVCAAHVYGCFSGVRISSKFDGVLIFYPILDLIVFDLENFSKHLKAFAFRFLYHYPGSLSSDALIVQIFPHPSTPDKEGVTRIFRFLS